MYLWMFTHANVKIGGQLQEVGSLLPPRWNPGLKLKLSCLAESFLPSLVLILKTRSAVTELELDILSVRWTWGSVVMCGIRIVEVKINVPRESPGGWLGRSHEVAERRGETERGIWQDINSYDSEVPLQPWSAMTACEETEGLVKAEIPSGYRYLVDKRMTHRRLCS